MREVTCREVQGALARDGAAPEQVAAHARHLRACADCRDQERARARIRDGILTAGDNLDDVTRARVLARLLEGRRQQRGRGAAAPRRAGLWLGWTLAFSAVMVVVSVLGLTGVLRSRNGDGMRAASSAALALEPYAVHGGAAPGSQALSSGGLDRVELPAHASMRARLGPAADFVLLGPLRLAVRGGDDRRAAVELQQGTLVGDFDGTKGRGLRIVTADATVEIVGTRFAVEASAQRTRVAVQHGRVRVESRGQVRLVGAQEEWSTDRADVEPLDAAAAALFERAARGNLEEQGSETAAAAAPPPIRAARPGGAAPATVARAERGSSVTKRRRNDVASPASRGAAVRPAAAVVATSSPVHVPRATELRSGDGSAGVANAGGSPFVAPAAATVAPAAATAAPAAAAAGPAAAPASSASAAAVSAAAPAPWAPAPSGAAHVATTIPSPPAAPLTPSGPEPAPRETAASLYRRAESALRQGDGAAGKKLLDELVRAFPAQPATDSARYELAVMAERAGAPDEALARTREILRPGAEGPFVEPARFLRCRVHLAGSSDQDRRSAVACLTRFVDDYPRSPHDEVALRALIELSRGGGRCQDARRYAELYLNRHPAGRFSSEAERTRSGCAR